MAQQGKITQEDVNAICERLRAQGKRPSTRLIRAEHGAGSTGTIQAMLRVWEANNPETETSVVLTTALQKTLQDNLGYEVSRAKQELHDKLEVASETISDLVRENEQLVIDNAQLEDANGKLLDGLAEAKGQVQQLQEDMAAAKAAEAQQRAEADQLRTALARAQLQLEQVEKLEASHATALQQLEQMRASQVESERLASVSAAQRDAHAERVTEEKARSEKLLAQVETLTQELSKASVRIEAAQGRFDLISAELVAAKEEAQQARATAAKAREAEAEWKGHAEELRGQLETRAGTPAGGGKQS